jgi:hypothetical protein
VITDGASVVVQRNGNQIMSVNDPAVVFGSRVGVYAEATGSGRIDDLVVTAATGADEQEGHVAHVPLRRAPGEGH